MKSKNVQLSAFLFRKGKLTAESYTCPTEIENVIDVYYFAADDPDSCPHQVLTNSTRLEQYNGPIRHDYSLTKMANTELT